MPEFPVYKLRQKIFCLMNDNSIEEHKITIIHYYPTYYFKNKNYFSALSSKLYNSKNEEIGRIFSTKEEVDEYLRNSPQHS